ncbi:MAG: type I DNA topoisomerase [Eubacteriales bacterium]|nr:type I DNA topoisomerase [Eubacteriales bacterium]
MAKYLVIVESPAKVNTIKKFLGKNYEVEASQGHVRDLPKSQMGIDIENGYEPKYITIRGKGGVLSKLRKEAKKATKVYLATDPDREGEAISWHLSQALGLEDDKLERISFNEITKNAVKNSLKESRKIDMNLVDAQQTRRILDRMVGYSISPLLWKKVKRGLSAGRVQSVALAIIAKREDEINSFIPEEYWTLEQDFLFEGHRKPLRAALVAKQGKKLTITDEAQMRQVESELEGVSYRVAAVKTGQKRGKSPLPFITSTLQQEASKVLNFSTKKTMSLAQQLYEGVTIKGSGTIGIITYLRTDSVRVSEEAKQAAKQYIEQTYGENYSHSGKQAAVGKNAQDAHEAIRPTDVWLTPVKAKDSLTRDQFRLYQLIWKRFVASQMQPVVRETLAIDVAGGDYTFRISSSKVLFDGYLAVYVPEEEKEKEVLVGADVHEQMQATMKQRESKQHFTQPPAHFTEASLVKALEELGIGRPSTYAPTITTILARGYVTKDAKKLYMTELGEVVNQIMTGSFPSIVDVNFTANLESLLDEVAEGGIPWKRVVRNFYPDLAEAVSVAEQELEKVELKAEESDELCELCGRNMVVKYGPHGKFLACPGFPECKNTKPYFEKTGVPCPKCGKEIVIKKTKKGRRYYGCVGHPECDFMSWQLPTRELCPICRTYTVKKGNKIVCQNETCGHVEKAKDEKGENE